MNNANKPPATNQHALPARHGVRRSSARAALAVLAACCGAALAPAQLRAGDDWYSQSGAGACAHSHAQPEAPTPSRDGHYDAAIGKNLLNYPPHRWADLLSMSLRIDIPDMNVPELSGSATLRLRAFSRGATQVELDAACLKIKGVLVNNAPATFASDDQKLRINLPEPVAPGAEFQVQVDYTAADPPAGLIWTLPQDGTPGRPAQIHTQGEPQTNSFWFPTHDFPHERLSTELIVTVPEGFVVCSNGALAERTLSNARETFRWVQERAHAPYLVTLVVGKFDVVDLGTPARPMPVFVPPGWGGRVPGTYGRTPAMVEFFERWLGEPFPWAKYAQVLVWNFAHGGMENTSATTMYDTAVLDETALKDDDLDGLISHELAHQWFGDLLTCRSWEHIWLNEGFATYLTHLWFEQRVGPDRYQVGLMGNRDDLIAKDRADAPFQPAMASKEYADPFEAFRRNANPYPKGAFILHMLRQKLGDELFQKGINAYVATHKDSAVETFDLRRVLEDVSGLSLEQFFNQWVFRPGVPKLRVDVDWVEADQELLLAVSQEQPINADNPAYEFDLPVRVRLKGDAAWRNVTCRVDRGYTLHRFRLEGEPEIVAVDPGLAVLADVSVAQPLARWLAQLEHGPTLAARTQAIDAMSRENWEGPPRAMIVDRLASLAKNERAFFGLRAAAIRGLQKLNEHAALAAVCQNPPEDPRVRRALLDARVAAVKAAGEEQPETRKDTLAWLTRVLREETSYSVRAGAAAGIGELKGVEAIDALIVASGVESQHDQIRLAVLEALAKLDDPRGLPLAKRYTKQGGFSRTRPSAVSAVANLAKHDPDGSFLLLSSLLDDREDRTVKAAGEGLVKLADARGEAVLMAHINTRRTPAHRQRAQKWLDDLQRRLAQAPQDPDEARRFQPEQQERRRLLALTRNAAEPTHKVSPGAAQAPVPGTGKVRWLRIASPERLGSPESARERLAALGVVAEIGPGGLAVLAWDTPVLMLRQRTRENPAWSVEKVDPNPAGWTTPAVVFRLDQPGQVQLGNLTGSHVGRCLLTLLGDEVWDIRPIDARLDGACSIMLDGQAALVETIAERLRQPGELRFALTPRAGELADEASLRAAQRGSGG
jgi:aminopeptidase N